MPERRLRSGPLGRAPSGRQGGFRGDEDGQLLILTGVLLVMGFVVVGSTLVQVQTLEESTSRIERDSVLDVFAEVVGKFNDTLKSGSQKGDTNVANFKERAGNAADRMRDAAIGRGLYLTAGLVSDPANSLFWSDDKCGAWSSKTEGVIVGYERETRTETIVGAVYDIYATNGDQTMTAKYYVKLYDCMLTTTTTYVEAFEINVADSVSGFDGAKAENDNAHASVAEKLILGAIAPATEEMNPNTATKDQWNDQGSIQHADADTAEHLVTHGTADYLRFYVNAGADTGQAWQDLIIEVDGWYTVGLGGLYVDDLMKIKGTYGAHTLGPYTVPVTAVNQIPGNYPTVNVPTNPEGDEIWTYDMLANTQWEISIDERGLRDPGVTWYIDAVTWTGNKGTAWHEADVEFEFDTIPDIFDNHDLDIRYRVTGLTADALESFTLQVWDGTQWNSRVTLTAPAVDTWTSATSSGTIPYRLTAAEFNDGAPRFRILDANRADLEATKASTLEIDYLKVISEFIP